MKAFHADPKIKAKYLARVQAHIAADELVRGTGWDPDTHRGCAVGCTLDAYDHKAYETELGIPAWLARIEDSLFECMSEEKSRTWPAEFLAAIHPGADLARVLTPFLAMLLRHSLATLDGLQCDREQCPDVARVVAQSRAAVAEMIEAQESGDQERIARAARAAARAAEAAEAARAAEVAEAARAAGAAGAARAAEVARAARAARAAAGAAGAAEAAAGAAGVAARAAGVAGAAWVAAYDHYADELLVILRGIEA